MRFRSISRRAAFAAAALLAAWALTGLSRHTPLGFGLTSLGVAAALLVLAPRDKP